MTIKGEIRQKIIILSIIIFIIFPFIIYSASCTPVSARICVGADDEAYVWINGNPVDDGTHFYAVQNCNNVPCANVPAGYLNAGGNNTIAVQNNNIITGFVWASWVLDITCFDGSHYYITSSDSGIVYYNQPLGNPAPANDGSGRAWYHPDYASAGTWGTPVAVTDPAAVYDCPAIDPRTGNYVRMLSYSSSAGANPGDPNQSPAGQILYFRQSFSFLQPVSIVKTINKTNFNLNETITYCFNYSNPESVARSFQLWDTIPAVTDFIGCNGGCSVQTYGSDVVVSWNINVAANGSGSVCMWVLAARYPFFNLMNLFAWLNTNTENCYKKRYNYTELLYSLSDEKSYKMSPVYHCKTGIYDRDIKIFKQISNGDIQ